MREWLPHDWLDEVTPDLQPTPEAFIEGAGEGWRLIPPEGSDDRDNEFFRTDIEPGQIVGFVYREIYGDFTITVNDDRTWTSAATWPEQATHFWYCGEIFDSMEEAVNPESWQGDLLEPGEHEISVGFWSASIHFRFDVTAEGQPSLKQVAGAN